MSLSFYGLVEEVRKLCPNQHIAVSVELAEGPYYPAPMYEWRIYVAKHGFVAHCNTAEASLDQLKRVLGVAGTQVVDPVATIEAVPPTDRNTGATTTRPTPEDDHQLPPGF
jgi:hypothetical protein